MPEENPWLESGQTFGFWSAPYEQLPRVPSFAVLRSPAQTYSSLPRISMLGWGLHPQDRGRHQDLGKGEPTPPVSFCCCILCFSAPDFSVLSGGDTVNGGQTPSRD